jgi:hypothetical protein
LNANALKMAKGKMKKKLRKQKFEEKRRKKRREQRSSSSSSDEEAVVENVEEVFVKACAHVERTNLNRIKQTMKRDLFQCDMCPTKSKKQVQTWLSETHQ